MATRAALTALIETNLESGTSITATEHREVEQAIVDSSVPYNVGYFNLGDVVSSTGPLSVYGALSATAFSVDSTSKIVVVFNTATQMPNANYYVRLFVQGLHTTTSQWKDACILTPIFINPTTSQFEVWIRESQPIDQNIRIYFEAVPL
jgi:hypothetical protein